MITTSSVELQPKDKVIKLKPFQARFISSVKRYPAMVSAWATGKSMCLIGLALRLCENENNLGVIFRREFVDLRDSTIKDFENYTGIAVNSERNAVLSNGSVIMFRHLEEMNNIQNMNLGWFGIEQAEELDNEEQFFKLIGRLRRNVAEHKGFVVANANGDDWIARLWGSDELGMDGTLGNSELVEAKTFDNKDVLPVQYVESLEDVRRNKPEIYERFVLNSRKVDEDRFVVLPVDKVRDCVNNVPIDLYGEKKRITVCDPAEGDVPEDDENMGEGGGDETVIYDMENGRILDQEIYRHVSLTDTMSKIILHAKKNSSSLICVDKVGIGAKLYSDLVSVYLSDDKMKIYGFDGRVTAPQEETYANYKTYAWFRAREKYFFNRMCTLPDDRILIRQLSKVKYRYTGGIRGGKYMLWPKVKMKGVLGGSPDRADAFIMGLDALDRADSFEGMPKSNHYIPNKFRSYIR